MLNITQDDVDKASVAHILECEKREVWLENMMIEIVEIFKKFAPALYAIASGKTECWYAGLTGTCRVQCSQGRIHVASIDHARPSGVFAMEDEKELKDRLVWELGRIKK